MEENRLERDQLQHTLLESQARSLELEGLRAKLNQTVHEITEALMAKKEDLENLSHNPFWRIVSFETNSIPQFRQRHISKTNSMISRRKLKVYETSLRREREAVALCLPRCN
jgi:hypothetical protein